MNSTGNSFNLQRYQASIRDRKSVEDVQRPRTGVHPHSMVDEQRKLESTMSATMLDFVHTYGLQVQPAAKEESHLRITQDLFDVAKVSDHYTTGHQPKVRPHTSNFNSQANRMYRTSMQSGKSKMQSTATLMRDLPTNP